MAENDQSESAEHQLVVDDQEGKLGELLLGEKVLTYLTGTIESRLD